MGGVTQGVRHRSGLVAAGAVGRGGHIPRSIGHADTAPGDIRHGRGRIAATIGVSQFHACDSEYRRSAYNVANA